MELSDILYTVLLAVLPISELRGAIPYAFFKGMSLWGAALLSIAGNMLVQPLFYIFISTFHKLLYVHWSFYQRIFDKTLARARAKVSKQIDKYGYWGLMVFVGIPLPLTGAWTGTLGAWILGLKRGKSFLFISLGLVMSAIIVSLILFTGVGINSIFIK